MADIGRSTASHVDYSVGHLALENWAAWIRSVGSPFPKQYPHIQPMFRDVEDRYPDEETTAPYEQYNPDDAEVTQGVIRIVCKERSTVVLHLSYIMRLSNIQGAKEMSIMDRSWRCDDKKYASWLDQAVASVDSAYLTLEYFD